ncbi:MAG: SIR2 family protein [Pseudomonadota bacterium]
MSDSYEKIQNIDPNSSVLLFGAGFSFESENILGKRPPNGSALRRHFISALGLPPDTEYDLPVLSDEFAEQDNNRLFQELYNIFRIRSIGPNQSSILSENWLRIYSTNYDDTVEIFRINNSIALNSFDSSDPIPTKLPKNSIIHLHGSIRAATPENIRESLVLGQSSYVRQYLEKSPWYSQFQADIKFASKIFIVGYSLVDYHISALLLQNPEIAKRTFFIQGPTHDDLFVRRTKNYGETLFIGLDGFASGIKKLPRPRPISDITSLKGFRYFDPQRDKKSIKAPTASEISDLLIFGAFNYLRCVSTLPNQSYVISRSEEIKKLHCEIEVNKSIIVDSRLGNGKSIFIYLALIELSANGYSCFVFKENTANLEEEINLIKVVPKSVIFFENYTSSQDFILKLQSDLPNAKFIFEIRTSIVEVRYHEIDKNIPKPYARIGLNRLSESDLDAFKNLCGAAGLGSAQIRKGITSSEMRDILLEIFESNNIRDKITKTLEPIFTSGPRRKILLLATLLSRFQVFTEPSFIKIVTGFDPYKEFHDIKEVSDELFEITLDEFRVRSSVFSEYAVQNLLDTGEIIECIVNAALAAASRKSERVYRVLMSNLIQYSNIKHVLKRHSDSTALVIGIYERLRYDIRTNNEPLFWLQYAILMVENKNLLTAWEFIETAYDCAHDRTGFQTYQIDTQAFRILLLSETENPSGSQVVKFEEILRYVEIINTMLNEESHRDFAIRVLNNIHLFLKKRATDLTAFEKTAMLAWLSTLTSTLNNLPTVYRANSGSDQISMSIESSKLFLST